VKVFNSLLVAEKSKTKNLKEGLKNTSLLKIVKRSIMLNNFRITSTHSSLNTSSGFSLLNFLSTSILSRARWAETSIDKAEFEGPRGPLTHSLSQSVADRWKKNETISHERALKNEELESCWLKVNTLTAWSYIFMAVLYTLAKKNTPATSFSIFNQWQIIDVFP